MNLKVLFSSFMHIIVFVSSHMQSNFTVDPDKIEIDVIADLGQIKHPQNKDPVLPKVPISCAADTEATSAYCYLLCRKNRYSSGGCDSKEGHCLCSGHQGHLKLYLMKTIKLDESSYNGKKEDPYVPSGRPKYPVKCELEHWAWDECICDNYSNCLCAYSKLI